MDNDEAFQLLERELAAFRDESYDELVRRIQSESVAWRFNSSGTTGAEETSESWRPSCSVSYLHALLGEKEEALVALEKACDGREFLLPFVSVDPVFDSLRAEPRFQAVLHRMGLVE